MVGPLVGCCVCLPVAAIFALRWYIRKTVKCPCDTRLDNKVVVITGASSGIGLAAAEELSRRGATVVCACRDRARGEAAAARVRRSTGSQRVHFLPLDVANFSSVREFIAVYQKKHGKRLDVLINNAAYMGPQAVSADQLDLTFHTNALGPFLLTRLVADTMERDEARPIRVINVVSDSYPLGTLDFTDLNFFRRPYDIYAAYGASKLALLLLTMESQARLGDGGVSVVAVHPGAVRSGLQRHWPGVFGGVVRALALLLFKTPAAGAQSVVYAAVEDDIASYLGKAICDCKPWPLQAKARDHKVAAQLWEVCSSMCGGALAVSSGNKQDT